MITTDINAQILYAVHADKMMTYIKGRHKWIDNKIQQINFNALGEAKKRQPQQQSQRTSKLLYG